MCRKPLECSSSLPQFTSGRLCDLIDIHSHRLRRPSGLTPRFCGRPKSEVRTVVAAPLRDTDNFPPFYNCDANLSYDTIGCVRRQA